MIRSKKRLIQYFLDGHSFGTVLLKVKIHIISILHDFEQPNEMVTKGATIKQNSIAVSILMVLKLKTSQSNNRKH